MSLILEIEFLTGVCRAARGVGFVEPDWPPQPDRIFSALVSAWGVRGENQGEREALEWLERQPPPNICASSYRARTSPSVFVPPNDLKSSNAGKKYIKLLPDHRPKQPRHFPVARPDDPKLELIWNISPTSNTFKALNAIAGCVGYIGHSASLARCQFVVVESHSSAHQPTFARRRVYPGRLCELVSAHEANPVRPTISPGASFIPEMPSTFGSSGDWLVLEILKSNTHQVPHLRASATICRLLRQSLMAGYRKSGRKDSIPEVVSGHAADGSPTKKPHLAIVPMAFVGFEYANADILGFALVPPLGESLRKIDGLRKAFNEIAAYCPKKQRRVIVLRSPSLPNPLELSPSLADGRVKMSLLPDPYLQPSKRWASVTPIVLERHLKRGTDEEARALIALACRNAGLPNPDLEKIMVDKHSAIKAAPYARPRSGAPNWTRWKVPTSLKSRQLVHAVIDFGRDVNGPVLLGSGRFTGLGLCRRLDN